MTSASHLLAWRKGSWWKEKIRSAFRVLCTGSLLSLLALQLPVEATVTNHNVAVATVQPELGRLALGSSVLVHAANLDTWAAVPGNEIHKLVPYINGRQITGLYPEEVHLASNAVAFHLRISSENDEVWADILKRPSRTRLVSFSMGPENHNPFPTIYQGAKTIELVVIPPGYGFVAGILITVLGIMLVVLARRTNMLRDTGDGPESSMLRPYNLGRTQMAIWFLIILSSYVLVWLITGNLDTVTESLLGLMGISAATALGDVLIDRNKRDARLAQVDALTAEQNAIQTRLAELQNPLPTPSSADASLTPGYDAERVIRQTRLQEIALTLQRINVSGPCKSEGFWKDILSDGLGYSFHRFQILAWTLVLMLIFTRSVFMELKMPEFSGTLLGLMGISSGTYIGFKFPEK